MLICLRRSGILAAINRKRELAPTAEGKGDCGIRVRGKFLDLIRKNPIKPILESLWTNRKSLID
jgi:hypothetical protein